MAKFLQAKTAALLQGLTWVLLVLSAATAAAHTGPGSEVGGNGIRSAKTVFCACESNENIADIYSTPYPKESGSFFCVMATQHRAGAWRAWRGRANIRRDVQPPSPTAITEKRPPGQWANAANADLA